MQSARLTAVAATRTSTSPGPAVASGTERTSHTSGLPGSVTTTARMIGPYPRGAGLRRAGPALAFLDHDLVEVLEPVQPAQWLRDALIALQALTIAFQERPIAGGERACVLAHPHLRVVAAAAAEVAHPVDVGAAARVRLRRHHPAVGVLRH